MTESVQERDYSIDWIKTIGILCLFLAHVDAPFWIKEIRGFDVPLMIFASGLLASGSLSRSESKVAYILKRVKRLIIPTWIFLFFFYSCMAVVGHLPDYLTIVKSFFFQRDGGIAGYTWIIWVYIVCAILTPLLVKIPMNIKVGIIVCIITIAYECICNLTNLSDSRLLYYTFFTIVPYGLYLLLSIKYDSFSVKQKLIIIIFFAVYHIASSTFLYIKNGTYTSIGDYKYPARLYYLSYAIPISAFFLWLFRLKHFQKKMFAAVSFISKHTLWIYLWHIFIIAILKYIVHIDNWIICYMILVALSIGITFLQNLLIRVIQKRKNFFFLKYFQG